MSLLNKHNQGESRRYKNEGKRFKVQADTEGKHTKKKTDIQGNHNTKQAWITQ